MADRKISQLSDLPAADLATTDYLPIVDVSEAAAVDRNKRVSIGNIASAAFVGTAAAPTHSFAGDQDTGMFLATSDRLAFATGGNEALRIDPNGKLLVGTSTPKAVGGLSGAVQVASPTADGSTLSALRHENGTGGSFLTLGKSRGTSVSDNTIVESGDVLGEIRFAGADGTDLTLRGGVIECRVDGTPGENVMPGRLMFSTNDGTGSAIATERMRITSNGRLYFGTTAEISPGSSTTSGLGLNITPDGGLLGKTTQTIGSTFFEQNITGYSSGNVFYQRFRIDGSTKGSISYDGTNIVYSTSSDYRLKENVVPLTGAVDRIKQLQVRRFNFIGNPDTTVDGFLAHEAQTVVPQCVTGTKDEVDADGNPVYQGIDQSQLVPLLTAALQEALAEIESLKARVTALEP